MKHGGAGKRRDANEGAIIEALRKYGAFVAQCHGDGLPDLIVRYRHWWTVMEVKTANGRLRPGQSEYPIVRSPDEALRLIGAIV